jgi:mannose/fructose/N-acetylgalactosamine-specific phosphotransferase system component IID
MSSSHSSFLECDKINHGVPQGSILGPLLFLFYANDLPKIVLYNSKTTLFTNGTSLILSNPNYLDFKTNITNVFSHLNKWLDNLN